MCGPHARFSDYFFFCQILLTLREHLIYIYHEYIYILFFYNYTFSLCLICVYALEHNGGNAKKRDL